MDYTPKQLRPQVTRCMMCGNLLSVRKTGSVPKMCEKCRRRKATEEQERRRREEAKTPKPKQTKQKSQERPRRRQSLRAYVKKMEKENERRKAAGLQALSYGQFVALYDDGR